MDAWQSLFPSDFSHKNAFLPYHRHQYSHSEILRLRHSGRILLPSSELISRPDSSPLPTFQFQSSDGLTADVLLTASESSLTFSDLRLSPIVISALSIQGFKRPSPIQLRTLPRARLGCDIIAHAKSGTGKTLAYILATLDALQTSFTTKPFTPIVLVLTPTREIALQVSNLFKSLCANLSPPPVITSLVGGTDERADVRILAGNPPSIVVGTPGRINSLANNAYLLLHAIQVLVLDEADYLLESSFAQDVRTICSLLPTSRQTLAFSATFPPWLRRVLINVMNNPAYITCDAEDDAYKQERSHSGNLTGGKNEDILAVQKSVLLGVRQGKLVVPASLKSDRLKLMVELLQVWDFELCIVFVNNRKDVSVLNEHFKEASINSRGINAGVKQRQRNAIISQVHNGDVRVLVTTDLLARGIDFPACDLVVHFHAPDQVATYLHRVGRAGRFGGRGRSIVMCNTDEDWIVTASLEHRLGFELEKVEGLSKTPFLDQPNPDADNNDIDTFHAKVMDKQVEDSLQHDTSNDKSNAHSIPEIEKEKEPPPTTPKKSNRQTSTQRESVGYTAVVIQKRGRTDSGDDSFKSQKRSRVATVKNVTVKATQTTNWEQLASDAREKGYNDAFTRAFRMAFELSQRRRQ